MPYNDLTGQASGHRTIRVALNDVVTCSAELLPGDHCVPRRRLSRLGHWRGKAAKADTAVMANTAIT